MLAWVCTGCLVNYLSPELLLDIPNQRSSHKKPVLRAGGLGFIVAFAITGTIFTVFNHYDSDVVLNNLFPHLSTSAKFGQICLILLPLTITGFIDDLQDVAASIRYLVQLLAAGLAVIFWGPIPLSSLTDWGIGGSIIAIVISLIAITANINFYNFMDGLDGLIASVTAFQLTFIALYLQQPIFLLLAAALAGFVYWNWSPAKIFMGDVGSTVLGATIAIALLSSAQSPLLAWSAFTVILPLLGDVIYTLIRRLLKQENIFQAHRTHIYQRLHQSGWSHAQVTTVYVILTAIAGMIIEVSGIWSIIFNLLLTISAIAIAETYIFSKTNSKTTPIPP
ncbi:MAG: glycosyltransferase family 4 protein [Waterburya sp.]